MNVKIGRNDLCHCGSGKKFKHCHGATANEPSGQTQPHANAVTIALNWLNTWHRKAFSQAQQNNLKMALESIFDNEDQIHEALKSMTPDIWEQIDRNATELLLSQGDIFVKGQYPIIPELLLSASGPKLNPIQRDWIEQLQSRPLRIYDVTAVQPGVGVTLCDAIETNLPPVTVIERAGSLGMRVGMQIGARLMRVGEQWQLSGAIYGYSMMEGRALVKELRVVMQQPGHAEDIEYAVALTIFREWLAQFFIEPELPEVIDQYSGEPLKLSTYYYKVLNWDTLATALKEQADVTGDRYQGWVRSLICHDGLTRPTVTINPVKKQKRISVFYRTETQASRGCSWLEQLAGSSIQFERIEHLSMSDLLANEPQQTAGYSEPSTSTLEFLPEQMHELFEKTIRRTYTNWADEPIPIFKGRTPREEMKTKAGLERVKGLLRQYQDGEQKQASQQGRKPVSYQFLWDALGLPLS